MSQSLIILLLVFVNATLTLAATNSNKPVDFNVVTDCENITPDGTTDITQAFQTCINDKLSNGVGGKIFLPSGTYLFSGTINFSTIGSGSQPLEFIGQGRTTKFLWSSDDDLFVFGGNNGEVTHSTFSKFLIQATGKNKNTNATALHFINGCTQSIFTDIMVESDDGNNIYPMNVLDLGPLSDTVSIIRPLFQNVIGTGVKIGRGSQVRLAGGRIFGRAVVNGDWIQGSIGVHCKGNNGGVHVDSTDLIGLQIGFLLDQSNGQGSNREIFISQGTIDSNYRGLAVHDNSYIDISGVWTASSGDANIYVASEASPLISLNGGTIFNAGAIPTSSKTLANDGIAWHGTGSFVISGVTLRNNKGKSLHIMNKNMKNFAVSGCQFYGNGMNLDIVGDNYTIVGNLFQHNLNGNTNNIGDHSHAIIANNLGL